MNEQVSATLKSSETEDWIDYHWLRPLGYRWAKLFAKLGTHPNTVTVYSMILGAVSCIFFAQGSIFYEGLCGLLLNVVGFLLLYWAYVFDNTDGQLARMTGKKSKLGRILDGAAGYAWYIPIYAAIVYRFYVHHDMEFSWLGIADTQTNALIATGVVFVLGLVSGVVCLANQQRTADYYIQIHLFFLKGEKGSELDNSEKQKELLAQMNEMTPWWERLVQKTYVTYTLQQEKRTPCFQALMAKLKEKYGNAEQAPQDVKDRIHAFSLSNMRYVFTLIFNFRTIFLMLFCVLDLPAEYFLFEIIVITLLESYTIRRHEAFCRQCAATID
ncbi:MAG: CDP-alcohol phosphatidyltransferase family protein [Bacteroidales bacterium]|nr:CDP-alcohol phosphatidyltransferase family protein [Bacteroidales bacterium]